MKMSTAQRKRSEMDKDYRYEANRLLGSLGTPAKWNHTFQDLSRRATEIQERNQLLINEATYDAMKANVSWNLNWS